METLILVVALMLASVVLVGLGDRVRLPWPALMVLLGAAVAVIPGLPDGFEIDPHLILPLFLPPLLFATAQRTSWSLFRARWRSIALLAVALVAATVAVVAGTAMALVPGIGLSAAIALGAMVAPPDPVAVEAVAGSVRIPRRLLAVLQSEGLFNDATALVVFQAAVLATVQGSELSAGGLLLRFVLGAFGAVLIGLGVAWIARTVIGRITTGLGRSALTLVLPFAVYLLAEEVHASGVVAVVVLALQLRATASADAAQERLMQGSFWDVVELLVTGVAFGLVGLSLREVVDDAGDQLPTMLAHALLVAVAAFAVRAVWMGAAVLAVRRSPDATAAPRTAREALVLTWCGMRGLATLALALSLPATTADGDAFPARTEILLIACTVLVLTLLLPGFTLPTLVRVLGVAEDAAGEHAAEEQVVQRARQAAVTTVLEHEHLPGLPEQAAAVLHERFAHLEAVLRGDTLDAEDRERLERVQRTREAVQRIQAEALAAARQAVLQARRQPGVDPEAADRVLRRLDQRTVLLE